MLRKRKFDEYVAAQEIVHKPICGTPVTIRFPTSEVRKRKFSKILARYINEQKAEIDNEYAYIIPNYDESNSPPSSKMIRKGKLLQCVERKSFITMINQAELVIRKQNGSKSAKQYFLKLSQELVRKYQYMLVIAALIEEKLAVMEDHEDSIYIIHNYQQKLGEDSKIQSDLSNFRQLLGETSNLKAIIEIIELCDIENEAMVIEQSKIKDNDLNTEIMSLCDIGIAKADTAAGKFRIDLKFASWVLEYVANTSDRISFSNMYG